MSASTSQRTIPVAKPFFGAEEEGLVLEVLRSGWVSQGPRVAEFERKFADYVGAADAVAVSSCTTAIHLALVAAGIGTGDEVLCPSFSFIATANAIVHAGGIPVFVDIDETTYNIDPNCIEAAITPRTKAILVVHQIGLPAAMDEIAQIAERHGLILIEDAACAIGAEYCGQRIGRPHSLMACFSFHPRKILTTGEGGMITSSDVELTARLRRLRQHAMSLSDVARHSAMRVMTESYDEIGYNFRMTDLQAAVGIGQLTSLDNMIARRRELAQRYTDRLFAVPWLCVPFQPEECRPNYQSYMVRLTDESPIGRDDLMQKMLDLGISTRRGVMAIHRELPYRDDELEQSLPVTNLVTDSTLILPLFHAMEYSEQDYIIECLEKLLYRQG